LHGTEQAFIQSKLPPFDRIIEAMRTSTCCRLSLLLKSRGECDAAVEFCTLSSDRGNNGLFKKDLAGYSSGIPI
jgi:hypothetical protein